MCNAYTISYYRAYTILTPPQGNASIGKTQVVIPPLVRGSISDVCIGKHTSFCVDRKKYKGLETLVHIREKNKDIFVIDNHNHALYCRYLAYKKNSFNKSNTPLLIHVDQHSDMGKPQVPYKEWVEKTSSGADIEIEKIKKTMSLTQVAKYVNEVLTINTFLIPAQEMGLIKDILQVRTEKSLIECEKNRETLLCNEKIILDIDTDFRDPRMSFENKEKSFTILRKRIRSPNVFCTTIATSPYFMDQEMAIKIVKTILQGT